MMLSDLIFGALAAISLVLTIWQFIVASRFPLHRRIQKGTFTPAITILKPLEGCDSQTEECLRSWLEQEHSGDIQVLFGVASADDPVCNLVRSLLAAHPEVDGSLVICDQPLGTNAKVSTLAQIEPQIRYEIIVISDADVHVPPDFLSNVAAPLEQEKVGLVNCFYELANPSTLGMRIEGIAINADFWGQVLQAKSLKPLDFALGAAVATRRSLLGQVGGFSALKDFLADDFLLGRRIAKLGKAIVLSPVVVICREAPKGWRQVWSRQLRWARTIRVCRPWPYFFSILGNGTLWPLLWLWVYPDTAAFVGANACFFVRLVTAQINEARLTRKTPSPVEMPMVLLKDLFGLIVWLQAFLGNRIQWRSANYRVLRSGRLEPLTKEPKR